jgi:hypothetical protein
MFVGPQGWSGHFGEEINLFPRLEIQPVTKLLCILSYPGPTTRHKSKFIYSVNSRTVYSTLKHTALNTEAQCTQHWSTVHSILKHSVLNTEAQCTQYWSTVHSILMHSSLNIEAQFTQYWRTVHSILKHSVFNTEVPALPYFSFLPNQYPKQGTSTILTYAILGSQGAQF